MARVFVALAALGLFGCTNVQVVQRDGCWVRRTESFPKNVKEEIGVCGRAPPVWSNDRVARLVQECMADEDYRWQNEALSAWNSGRPLPPQRSEHDVMQECMHEAATSVVAENEALKKRLGELESERDSLRSEAAQDRQNLRDAQSRMTDALGEAAKRPAPNAYASANSNGSATTRSDQQAPNAAPVPTAPASPTVVPVPVIETVPAPAPAPRVAHPRANRERPACNAPGSSPNACELPKLPSAN